MESGPFNTFADLDSLGAFKLDRRSIVPWILFFLLWKFCELQKHGIGFFAFGGYPYLECVFGKVRSDEHQTAFGSFSHFQGS